MTSSAPALGQGSRPAPLGKCTDVMVTLNILKDAEATNQRAVAHETERYFFPAVDDYERFIERWEAFASTTTN